MPRTARIVAPGVVLHVLNRANRRALLFSHHRDYEFFSGILTQAVKRESVELFAYCVMPNHWHLVLRPADGPQLARFMHWLTTKHTRAVHAFNGSAGVGHLYQGRFKAFPVERDSHFLAVCRYVERNPLRAGLVTHANAWPWSSHRANSGYSDSRDAPSLAVWPLERPTDWQAWVDFPQTDGEVAALRRCVKSNTPFGSSRWREALAARLGKEGSPRKSGRPRRDDIRCENDFLNLAK